MQVLGGCSSMTEVARQRHVRDVRITITMVTADTSQMQCKHVVQGMGLRPR
ncbi:hypothetical protein GCM10010210_02050 [Pseudonocardia hydrocarbonoxydans]|uniref:Uncharacterized protein n=2 Tax=Pseudonocardiaceae TaxID=2070 RepID=A0ABS6V1L8_9PSEU|nr:hypothetical protein [Pseudonocardia abyssalis]MBW0138360.1 hypothetical protein [Pseudonocardia abyssalis]